MFSSTRWKVTTQSPTNHAAVIARSRNNVNTRKRPTKKPGKISVETRVTGYTFTNPNRANQQLSVTTQSNPTAPRSSNARGPHINHTGTAIPTAPASRTQPTWTTILGSSVFSSNQSRTVAVIHIS